MRYFLFLFISFFVWQKAFSFTASRDSLLKHSRIKIKDDKKPNSKLHFEFAPNGEAFKFFGSENDGIQFGVGLQVGIGYFSKFVLQSEISTFASQNISPNVPIEYMDSLSNKIAKSSPVVHIQTKLLRYGVHFKYIIAPSNTKHKNQIYLLGGLDFLKINYEYPKYSEDVSAYPNVKSINNGSNSPQQLSHWNISAGAGYEGEIKKWLLIFGEMRGSYPLNERSANTPIIEIVPTIRINLGVRLRLNVL